MISINYDLIREWLKKKKITLRKMCEDTGMPEGTIYSSFKRESKMQVAYVWRIADYMDVRPFELLEHDENGNVDPADYERVSFGRTDYEIEIENQSINDLVYVLRQVGVLLQSQSHHQR